MDHVPNPADHLFADGPTERLSVGDPILRKSRVLSRQCDTCIFHPGNRMRLAEGRLRQLVAETRSRESFIICHDTLPYHRSPGVKPAICRGFFGRYFTQALQIIGRLFGFIEVDPPTQAADGRSTIAGAGTDDIPGMV